MIYLDTDFLVHFLVVQDRESHRIVLKRIKPLLQKNLVFISLLTLQEVSFVLSKLDYDNFEILEKVEQIEKLGLVNYSRVEFDRAKYLASKIGFNNINDCLHLAIAETHCKELYTFNKNDFEKLKPLSNLKITIF